MVRGATPGKSFTTFTAEGAAGETIDSKFTDNPILSGSADFITLRKSYSEGAIIPPMTYGRQFGNFVKHIRTKTGMSIQRFAEYMGVPAYCIWTWEKGIHTPQRRNIELLSQIANRVSGSTASSLTKRTAFTSRYVHSQNNNLKSGPGRRLPEFIERKPCKSSQKQSLKDKLVG